MLSVDSAPNIAPLRVCGCRIAVLFGGCLEVGWNADL
jgi:hypothetical protein